MPAVLPVAVQPWLAWAGALAFTLVLAAWCTPRAWWRRPNLRALAVLGGGTLAFGLFFSALLPAAPPAPARVLLGPLPAGPEAGGRYRVIDDLNLRADHGVRATRVRVLAAGTIVSATGATDGDWWRVRVDGSDVEGWASSLWLRRTDERH
jgi:hypothetical protein